MSININDGSVTRKFLGSYLAEIGLDESVAELILNETAAIRHRWRIEAARNAAIEYGREIEDKDAGEPLAMGEHRTAIVYAAIAIVADTMGIGGRSGVSGAATERHPAFVALGKGRKQAKDGDAWSAAIQSALMLVIGGDNRLTFDASTDGLTASLRSGEIVFAMCALPNPWGMTIAREGLRRSLGLPGWFQIDQVAFSGEPKHWGDLVIRLRQAALAEYMTNHQMSSEVVANDGTATIIKIKLVGLPPIRFVETEGGRLVISDPGFVDEYTPKLGSYLQEVVEYYEWVVNKDYMNEYPYKVEMTAATDTGESNGNANGQAGSAKKGP